MYKSDGLHLSQNRSRLLCTKHQKYGRAAFKLIPGVKLLGAEGHPVWDYSALWNKDGAVREQQGSDSRNYEWEQIRM